jgi:tetratricopeptide (TPR) repeat protein
MTRIDQLLKLAQSQPDDPLIHYGIGLEYANQERWAEALAMLERTLKIDPQYVAAFFQKARAELKLGRRSDAAATLAAGIRQADERGDRHSADEMRKMLETLALIHCGSPSPVARAAWGGRSRNLSRRTPHTSSSRR